jgi:hypothetical protein
MQPATAPDSDRLGWIAVFATLGYLAAAVPCWMQGMPGAGIWSWAGALAGVVTAIAVQHRPACHGRLFHLACIVAVCAAISVDFALVSPLAIVALCGSGSDNAAGILFTTHLRWFPATSLAMLAMACCRHLSAVPRAPRAWLCAGISFAGMLVVMSLTVRGFRMLASAAGWDWSPNSMTGAMVVGMALLACAQRLRSSGRTASGASAGACAQCPRGGIGS